MGVPACGVWNIVAVALAVVVEEVAVNVTAAVLPVTAAKVG